MLPLPLTNTPCTERWLGNWVGLIRIHHLAVCDKLCSTYKHGKFTFCLINKLHNRCIIHNLCPRGFEWYIIHGPSHLFIKTNYIYCRRGILNSRVPPAWLTATTTEFDWAGNELGTQGCASVLSSFSAVSAGESRKGNRKLVQLGKRHNFQRWVKQKRQ
jgi:hypothetical protein